MEVFVRVAESGSFSRAAESMDLANATVTTCLRNLERHLGITLINRDTRRLRLTEEGQTYLARAREVLAAVALGEEELHAEVNERRGRLNVEINIALGRVLLCPALPVFAKRYPNISTEITLSNTPHNLVEHAVDVAVRFGEVNDGDVVTRPLHPMRYVVCCTPAMAATLPAHPRELDPRLCLGILQADRYSINTWHLEKGDEQVEIRPDGPLHCNSGDELLAAADAGSGVACVLDVLAARHLAEGSLVQVYPEWSTPNRMLYMVVPRSRIGLAKVKAFTDFLLEVFDAHRRPPARRAAGAGARRKR